MYKYVRFCFPHQFTCWHYTISRRALAKRWLKQNIETFCTFLYFQPHLVMWKSSATGKLWKPTAHMTMWLSLNKHAMAECVLATVFQRSLAMLVAMQMSPSSLTTSVLARGNAKFQSLTLCWRISGHVRRMWLVTWRQPITVREVRDSEYCELCLLWVAYLNLSQKGTNKT